MIDLFIGRKFSLVYFKFTDFLTHYFQDFSRWWYLFYINSSANDNIVNHTAKIKFLLYNLPSILSINLTLHEDDLHRSREIVYNRKYCMWVTTSLSLLPLLRVIMNWVKLISLWCLVPYQKTFLATIERPDDKH